MGVARRLCCGGLRLKCLIIGYLNLVSCVVDIGFQVLIAAIVSRGFQCDVDKESLAATDWPWLEPLLVVVNLGTHGFYPFPPVLRPGSFEDCLPLPHPARCYPAMLHVYLIDVLNFLINFIWLKFVWAYISALHMKDPKPMRTFFYMSLVKVALQIMYFAYQPFFKTGFTAEINGYLKIADVGIATIFLFIINEYIHEVRREKIGARADTPPTYVECLVSQLQLQDQAKKLEQPLPQPLNDISIVSTKSIQPAEKKQETDQ